MTREPIEVTRQDRIYCLKVSSDYHSEVCEECKFYPNCDHMTQDDMTELTIKDLEALEQKPQTFKWCTDCKEYDQEKHCCHRWSKVIRDTVEEMKQEYIERNVLDKLRAEIKQIKPSQGHFYDGVAKCLEILDKYKAESEADNG